MARARWSIVSLAVGLWIFSAPAAAQSVARDPALGETLFRQGREHLQAGRVPEACQAFQESFVHDPATGTLHNLASCHERMGQVARAWAEYDEVFARAQQARDWERAELAKSQRDALYPQLPRLNLHVSPTLSRLPGFRLEVDGRELGAAAFSAEIPVDIGEHVIRARADGHVDWVHAVTVEKPGERLEVTVPALERLEPTKSPEPAGAPVPRSAMAPPVASRESARGSTLRTWAYVSGGAGLVGLGAAGVFGIVALGKKNDRDELCDAGQCSSAAGVAAHRDANSAGVQANVFGAVGALLVGTGVVLFLIAPDDEAAPSVGMALDGDSEQASVRAFGRW